MNVTIRPALVSVTVDAPQISAGVDPPVLRLQPDPYPGPYAVTAADEDVVLDTSGHSMTADVTVHPLPAYAGAAEIAPTRERQTIPTAGLRMAEDLTVLPIPPELVDVSDTTAAAADVLRGKIFHAADGARTEGTMSAIPVPAGFAYYNGYLLPELPQVEGYGYCWIRDNGQNNTFDAVFGKAQWRSNSSATLDSWQLLFTGQGASNPAYQYSIPKDGSASSWDEPTQSTASYYGTSLNRKVIWSSHDIMIGTTSNVLYKHGIKLPT